MAVEDDGGDRPVVAAADAVEGHVAPREQRRGAVLCPQSQYCFARAFGLVAMRFRASIPAILIRSPLSSRNVSPSVTQATRPESWPSAAPAGDGIGVAAMRTESARTRSMVAIIAVPGAGCRASSARCQTSCISTAALNGPLSRRVWRGPPVPQRRRRPSSPARFPRLPREARSPALAVLRCAAALRVRDRPPPA